MDIYNLRRKTEKRVVELEKIVNTQKSIICLNVRCGKAFQKVLMLTDLSKTPRETYHACPYCFSKVEIAVKEKRHPLECPYYFGFLKTFPKRLQSPTIV